jgi:hypothetical protein
MCLRCGRTTRPYQGWPTGELPPGDYGIAPRSKPPNYGSAPRGGFFSIVFATGRDYYLEEGPPDYGRAIGGNILTPLRRVV